MIYDYKISRLTDNGDGTFDALVRYYEGDNVTKTRSVTPVETATTTEYERTGMYEEVLYTLEDPSIVPPTP